METNSILTANILDILFDGRNKEYGAYELRKTYEKRIGAALGGTALAIFILFIAVAWKKPDHTKKLFNPDTDLKTQVIIEPPKIDPPAQELPKQKVVKSSSYTPPLIVQDDKVTKPPIEVDKLEGRIDVKTVDAPIENTVAAPVDIPGSQVMEKLEKKDDNLDKIFFVVEKDAMFKGNWGAFLKKEIEKNMDELTDAGESGTCMIRFVVSKDGSVSDVEAITMKGTKLAEVAVNSIRRGPKWIPAEQNGTIVNAYRMQPVTFQINN